MRSGPVIIGFDGSPASEQAVREAAALLAPRKALVIVVWEAGRAFDLAENPSAILDYPPATIDLRGGYELDAAMAEAAQRQAQRGAALAAELGFDAEGLAVADEHSVAGTLVRLAEDHDAAAVVVGAHGHNVIREALLGSTSRELIQHAPCPIVVVRSGSKDAD